MFEYVIASIVPVTILFILISSLIEKKDTLKLFSLGVINGLKTTYKIFPYVFAITIAANLLRETGAVEMVIKPLEKVLKFLKIPTGTVPLIVLRPMSGSASTAITLDIIRKFGVDSIEGRLAAVIMGGTETTLYAITILLGSSGIKNYRGAIIAGLVADFVAIFVAIILLNIGFI